MHQCKSWHVVSNRGKYLGFDTLMLLSDHTALLLNQLKKASCIGYVSLCNGHQTALSPLAFGVCAHGLCGCWHAAGTSSCLSCCFPSPPNTPMSFGTVFHRSAVSLKLGLLLYVCFSVCVALAKRFNTVVRCTFIRLHCKCTSGAAELTQNWTNSLMQSLMLTQTHKRSLTFSLSPLPSVSNKGVVCDKLWQQTTHRWCLPVRCLEQGQLHTALWQCKG